MSKSTKNKESIFGVSLKNPLGKTQEVAEILFEKAQGKKSTISICSLNPEILLKASDDPQFSEMLNGFDERLIDGFGIQLVLFLKGGGCLRRFTGADLSEKLLNFAKSNNLNIGVIIRENGWSSKREVDNFFRSENLEFIVLEKKSNETNATFFSANWSNLEKTQIIFVFLGAPEQEKFLIDFKNKFSGPKIGICAGGTIDFWTKKKARAPKIFRKMGLEWLCRLLNQPNRILRIWNAVVIFPIRALSYRENEDA